jgi:hypothetical protein
MTNKFSFLAFAPENEARPVFIPDLLLKVSDRLVPAYPDCRVWLKNEFAICEISNSFTDN